MALPEHQSPLFYQRRGQSGTPLILLHGWGFQHQVWDALTSLLEPHCPSYAVDLPGYGQSAARLDDDLDSLTDWLAAQLPRGVWLGWSLGGLLAINLCLRHPDKVQGLYLVSTTPRFLQAADWSHAMQARIWQSFSEQLQAHQRNTLQRFLALQVKGDTQARDLLRPLRRHFTQAPMPSTEVLAQGLRLLGDSDLRSQVSALRCPTCLVLGARDALVPLAVKDAWRALLTDTPATIKIFPNAAHMPFASHLEAFADHLYHWLHDNLHPPTKLRAGD